jgi:hypothetical protein
MSRIGQDRLNLVTRTIDSALLAIVSDPEQRARLSVRDLLEIRRAMLGPSAQRLTISRGVDEGAALADLYLATEKNPSIAGALRTLAVRSEAEDDPEPESA